MVLTFMKIAKDRLSTSLLELSKWVDKNKLSKKVL